MTRRFGIAALALWLSVADLAHAASASEVRAALEVKRYLNAAVALYEKLDYEQALKQLARAKKKATSADDEGRIALMEGIVLAELGRESAAVDAFTTGFGLDAEAKLPLDVSPKVAAIAEQARESVKRLLGGTLERQRADAEAQRAAELEAARLRAAAEAAPPSPPPLPPPDAAPARPKEPSPQPSASARGRGGAGPWIALAVSGAATAGSAAYFTSAWLRQRALTDGSIDDVEEAKAAVTAGKRESIAGVFLGAAAAAALVTSVTLFVLEADPGGSKSPTVLLVPLAGGGLVTLSGPLPR